MNQHTFECVFIYGGAYKKLSDKKTIFLKKTNKQNIKDQ